MMLPMSLDRPSDRGWYDCKSSYYCLPLCDCGCCPSGIRGIAYARQTGCSKCNRGSFTVALAAALTVYWMTRLSIPVSTTQAIVGAIIGWNFCTNNPTDLTSLTQIVTTWISGPILGALFAIALFALLRYLKRRIKFHLIIYESYLRTGLIIVGAFGSFSLGANNIANVMGVFLPSVKSQRLYYRVYYNHRPATAVPHGWYRYLNRDNNLF